MTKTFANCVTCVHLSPVRYTLTLLLCRACLRALVGPQAGGCDGARQHAGAVSPWLSWCRVRPSVSDGLAGVLIPGPVSPCLASGLAPSSPAAPFAAGDVSRMLVPGGGVSQP